MHAVECCRPDKYQYRTQDKPTDTADIVQLRYRDKNAAYRSKHGGKSHSAQAQIQPELFVALGVNDMLGFELFGLFFITIHTLVPLFRRQGYGLIGEHLAEAHERYAGAGADNHIGVGALPVCGKQVHIARIVLAILLALHVAVDKEQADIAVTDNSPPLAQCNRAVLNVRFHTVAVDAHGKVRRRAVGNLVIGVIVAKSR